MGKAKKLAGPRASVTEGFDPKVHGVCAQPLVLVIVPTRELACQIFDEARRLCYRSMLRPCVAYGGGPVSHQRMELQKGCDILIGTPGRLLDFMGQSHVLSLRRVQYVTSSFNATKYSSHFAIGTPSSTKPTSSSIPTGKPSLLNS